MEQAVVDIILRYLQRQESPEELEEVLGYLQSGRHGQEWEAALERHARMVIDRDYEATMTELEISGLQARIRQQIASTDEPVLRPARKKYRWLPYVAAAALIVMVGSWLFYGETLLNPSPAVVQTVDIAPGGNHARITLADGRVINLDSVGTGLLTLEQGVAIRKGENGLITYEIPDEVSATDAPAFHTISTPRGGQYQVLLPDGTRVWLNAASTLKYPLRFAGEARVVELEGEGYFNVNEQWSRVGGRLTKQPFIVKTRKQEVEVLGTQFNVSAYADEPVVQTTLVEGSVRVATAAGGEAPVMLKPGQQSSLHKGTIRIQTIDVEPYIAWKEGVFAFYDLNTHEMIRQIERWYDVQFDTTGMPADDSRFSGEIRRDVPLSKLLDLMSRMAAPRYQIEGRRVIVYK